MTSSVSYVRKWGIQIWTSWPPGLTKNYPCFFARSKDPPAVALDALITPWKIFWLIFAFSPAWILLSLLRTIKLKNCLLHPTGSEEPGTQTYLVFWETTPGPYPNRPDMLSQGSPLLHSVSKSVALLAWLLKHKPWQMGISDCYFPLYSKQEKSLNERYTTIPGNHASHPEV